MRTTLTLDPDVVRMLEDEMHRQRKPFKQIVNEAIRRGVSPRGRSKATTTYRVEPHRASLLPGLDRAAFNKLVDDLEDASVLKKRRRIS